MSFIGIISKETHCVVIGTLSSTLRTTKERGETEKTDKKWKLLQWNPTLCKLIKIQILLIKSSFKNYKRHREDSKNWILNPLFSVVYFGTDR